ncbi:MAG TPA: bifunctional 3'-5' exonuclease/DNA polymerase [Candidatus Dormibacteraeota bacterium]|nr:bifunctional 3'-5' exonuclease/DNA polymerase [Candidatus Dormibacteraeota bacterium]
MTFEGGQPPPDAVADGRDILAALADRGISVRLGDGGRPWAGPTELIDDADRALLAVHRDAILTALRAESPVHVLDGELGSAFSIHVPGNDPGLLDDVAAVLARHPGTEPVLLHLEAAGCEVTMLAGERFRVTAGPALAADLEACFERHAAVLQEAGEEAPPALTAAAAPVLRLEIEGLDVDDQPRVTPGAQAADLDRVMVTTASEWERMKADVLAAPALGLDTEGTGLDPFTSRLRLVQLAAHDRVYVVDAFRLDARTLQPALDHARRLVGHNLKFDYRMLMAAGLRLPADIGRRTSDTMLAGLLLGAGIRGERYRLGDLTQRYLGIELDKTEQVSDWAGNLTDEQLLYAARDAAVLLPLRARLRDELERAELGRVAAIESRTLPAMAWLEQTGAPLERTAWLALAEIAEERRRGLERELDALAPPDMPTLPLDGLDEVSARWSSPAQVLKVLEGRGVTLPNTRDETLREHHDDDPLIPVLLEHRDAAKRCGAFGREFLRHVHPVTGRVHVDYFQAGTAAGRMSARNPNLQQMPRDPAYRACVRAPEGRVLVKADYAAIEMRVAAEIANDQRLIEAFDSGADVHRLTAASIMGRPQSEITKADRQAGKAAGFGLLFGMGAPRLRSYAKFAYGVEMTDEEAVAYRERFFEMYVGLRRWHRSQPEGVVETRTLAGRRRLGIENRTEKLNSPVQGSAADGLKLALGLLHETRDEVPSAAPILAVHDEIVLECDRQDAERAREWLERCMREGMGELLKRVPVEVEGQIGRDWSMTEPATEREEAA